jgi:hypothetical protein
MKGYNVVTTDDERVGHIVGMQGDYYIVESGSMLKKARYPLPKRYTTVEPERERVLIRMSRETLFGAPTVGRDGTLDELAVAAYWGE